MVALNTMLAEDGAVIDVPANTDAGLIHLISLATDTAGGASDFHPRHIIRLAPGATLTVLETVARRRQPICTRRSPNCTSPRAPR